jgi:hypothetical protein
MPRTPSRTRGGNDGSGDDGNGRSLSPRNGRSLSPGSGSRRNSRDGRNGRATPTRNQGANGVNGAGVNGANANGAGVTGPPGFAWTPRRDSRVHQHPTGLGRSPGSNSRYVSPENDGGFYEDGMNSKPKLEILIDEAIPNSDSDFRFGLAFESDITMYFCTTASVS